MCVSGKPKSAKATYPSHRGGADARARSLSLPSTQPRQAATSFTPSSRSIDSDTRSIASIRSLGTRCVISMIPRTHWINEIIAAVNPDTRRRIRAGGFSDDRTSQSDHDHAKTHRRKAFGKHVLGGYGRSVTSERRLNLRASGVHVGRRRKHRKPDHPRQGIANACDPYW